MIGILQIYMCAYINTTYVFVYNYLVIQLSFFPQNLPFRKHHYIM